MIVDNTEVVYFIDYIEKKVHLADLTRSSIRNLPNNIGPEFLEKIIEQEHLMVDVLDFEWVCYCLNGLIFIYKDYSMVLVDHNEKWLHRPFLSLKLDY